MATQRALVIVSNTVRQVLDADTLRVGAGLAIGGAADASAALTILSTTGGFLPPAMTTTQRLAIASPAEGLIVHDATLHLPFQYRSGAWGVMGNAAPPVYNAFAYTYAFGGGLVDFTANTNFTLSAYTPIAAYQTSAILGDGTNQPYFYCFHRNAPAEVAILQQTSGGSLRVGPSSEVASTDAFPFAQTGCSIAIPLPQADFLQIDFTLSTNCGQGKFDGGVPDRGFVALAGVTANNALYNLLEVGFVWDTGALAIFESYVGPQTTASRGPETSAAADPAFFSAVTATRRYRMILDGGVLTLLGAPTSAPTGTPSDVLLQVSDVGFSYVGYRRFLVLSCAGSNGDTRGIYAEFKSSLLISGIRSYL